MFSNTAKGKKESFPKDLEVNSTSSDQEHTADSDKYIFID